MALGRDSPARPQEEIGGQRQACPNVLAPPQTGLVGGWWWNWGGAENEVSFPRLPLDTLPMRSRSREPWQTLHTDTDSSP